MSRTDKRPEQRTRVVTGEVEIDVSPADVWRALTDARELERWFPLEARVEPGEGGALYMSWKNEYAGTSRIVSWEPERHLKTTWGFEGEGPADIVQYTDYWIESRLGRTVVRVVTSGFLEGPEWDGWFESTYHGWRFELRSLKQYLEWHRGQDRGVVYLRRRTGLTRNAVWERLFGEEGVGPRPFNGEVLLHDPPHQHAELLPLLNNGLARLSADACLAGAHQIDVTLWLSAWGPGRARLDELRPRWEETLIRLFPEGAAP